MSLQSDIKNILNKHYAENESDTPDFILAEYLIQCLGSFNKSTVKRDKWYRVRLEPTKVGQIKPNIIIKNTNEEEK